MTPSAHQHSPLPERSVSPPQRSQFQQIAAADFQQRAGRDAAVLLLYVDGTPGFPQHGVAGLGLVLYDDRGRYLDVRSLRAPARTSQEAEYQAIIAGLLLVRDHYSGRPIRCMSDSRVAVDQLTGRAAVRTSTLQPLHEQARLLVAQLGQIHLFAIPREQNRLADALAWEALYRSPTIPPNAF